MATNLPKYVYKGKSSYEYRPYVSRRDKRKCISLCPLNSPMSKVWAEWERLQEHPNDTLAWLLEQYQSSREFEYKGTKPKAPSTIREQRRYAALLTSYPLQDSRTFGSVSLKSITPGVIRKYLDKRFEEGARVSGNREKALISKAWNWGAERDMFSLANPCDKVSRNPEESRKHYVLDTDYDAFLDYVRVQGPNYLWVVCELAYLCRMRKIEILTAKKSQILDKGFETLRRKGSRDAVTLWSNRLTDAIKAASNLPLVHGVSTTYLIHDKYGQPIKESTFNTSWQRRMREAVDSKGIARFTTHDLKRKGASDSDIPATESTGNSPQSAKVYDVSKLVVSPTK